MVFALKKTFYKSYCRSATRNEIITNHKLKPPCRTTTRQLPLRLRLHTPARTCLTDEAACLAPHFVQAAPSIRTSHAGSPCPALVPAMPTPPSPHQACLLSHPETRRERERWAGKGGEKMERYKNLLWAYVKKSGVEGYNF